ncbi:hypothetical protein D3C76_849900 [compost metagenome]
MPVLGRQPMIRNRTGPVPDQIISGRHHKRYGKPEGQGSSLHGRMVPVKPPAGDIQQNGHRGEQNSFLKVQPLQNGEECPESQQDHCHPVRPAQLQMDAPGQHDQDKPDNHRDLVGQLHGERRNKMMQAAHPPDDLRGSGRKQEHAAGQQYQGGQSPDAYIPQKPALPRPGPEALPAAHGLLPKLGAGLRQLLPLGHPLHRRQEQSYSPGHEIIEHTEKNQRRHSSVRIDPITVQGQEQHHIHRPETPGGHAEDACCCGHSEHAQEM